MELLFINLIITLKWGSRMKKLDYVVIISLLVISLLSSGIIVYSSAKTKYQSQYVEISVKGDLYKKIPINSNTEETIDLKTDLGENVIKISKGFVQILEADCPDKICVKDGSISKPGQSLVCLPNKVVVEIKGIKNVETDDVSF
jgi:hypothetical protein